MARSSIPTRSFIVLLLMAVLASAAATLLVYTFDFTGPAITYTPAPRNAVNEQRVLDSSIKNTEGEQEASVDTSNWGEYKDANYALSFKVPKDWKLTTTVTSPDIYTLVLQPTNTPAAIKIFVSSDNYVGLTGLKTEAAEIDGQKAVTVDNMLFGVRHDSQYYTFDLGNDLRLHPHFKALVASVKFTR